MGDDYKEILDLRKRVALIETRLEQLFEHLDIAPRESAGGGGRWWGGGEEAGGGEVSGRRRPDPAPLGRWPCRPRADRERPRPHTA